MKKLILFLAVLVISLSALVSCGETEVKNNQNENDTAVWYHGASVNVVFNDDVLVTEENIFSVNDFLDSIFAVTEKYPNYVPVSAGSEEKKHEIVVGESDRSVSETAYKRLSWLLEEERGHRGWLIYAYNGSLAIAYDCELSMRYAIDYFKEELLAKNETFDVKNGIVKSETFNYRDKVTELREEQRRQGLDELVPILGNETVAELRKLYSLYGDEIYFWMANLYDPESGGFYYSNSGRDHLGFGADIESTVQLLSHLESGGMFINYGDSYATGIPDEIREGLIRFARGLQSPEDGYFYHPQWGTEIVASRRGRDLGWATQMLKAFGVKPLYNAPDGTKGELGAPGQTSAFKITDRLSASGIAAVSKVVLTNTTRSSLPECLRSISAWGEYLDELDIYHNSYYAGNTLAAMHGQITQAGTEYVNYLIDYLNKLQNPELGLWANEITYDSVNGLMKIISTYNYHHVLMPNADKAMASAMEIALEPDSDYHVCCVYNPWVTMNLVISLTESYGDRKQANDLRAQVLEKSAELVSTTFNKLQKYIVEGGFHYHATLMTNTSQEAAVGCATEFEADVNATSICTTGILSNIYETFGVPKEKQVRLYCAEDGNQFLEELLSLDEIIKNTPEPVEPKPFDDYDKELGDEEFGMVNIPSDNGEAVIPDKTLGDDGNYKYYSSAVTNDPKPSSDKDLAFNMQNFVYNYSDGTREYASSMMSTAFKIENSYVFGNTYILDTDIMVDRSSGGVFMQLFLQGSANTLSLNFETYVKSVPVVGEDGEVTMENRTFVKISDNFEGADGERDTNIIDTMELGEWFNLRIELYKIYSTVEGQAGKNLDIKAKIFIDGEFVGESEAFKTLTSDPTKYSDSAITQAKFALYRFNDCSVWLDNMFVEKSDKKYEHEEIPVDPSDIPESVPTPDGEAAAGEYFNSDITTGKRYDFESSKKAPSPSNSLSAKTWLHKLTDTEGQVTNVMVYFWRTEGGDGTSHEATSHSYNPPQEIPENMVIVAEMDFAIGGLASGTGYQHMIRLYGGGYVSSLYMGTDKDGNLSFTGAKNVNSSLSPMKQNTWYNIRYEGYVINSEKMTIKVFVNGEYYLEADGLDFKSSSSNMFYNQMQYTMDAGAWMLYDNVFAGYDVKEYTLPEGAEPPVTPDTPVIPDKPPYTEYPSVGGPHTGGYYYESSDAFLGNRFDFEESTSEGDIINVTDGNISGKDALIWAMDESGKFVSFVRPSGLDKKYYLRYSASDFTEPYYDHVMVIEQDIFFTGLAPSSPYSYVIDARMGSGVGKRVQISLGTNAEGKITVSNVTSSLALDQNTWYSLRFEIYPDGNIKIFVDNEYSDTVKLNVDSSSNSTRVIYYIQGAEGSSHGIYLDNLFIGALNQAYVPEEGEEETPGGGSEGEDPDEGEDPELPPSDVGPTVSGNPGGGQYYNGSESGKRYDFTSGTSHSEIINTQDNSSAAEAILQAMKEGNGFVHYSRPTAEKIKYYLRYNASDAAEALENHVTVIEQDMAFTGLAAGNAYAYYIAAYTGSGVGDMVQIYFGSDADGKIGFITSGGRALALEQDTWYNIRFEIYSGAKVKIYVNGEFSSEIQATLKSSSNSTRVLYYIQEAEGSMHGLCIDNLYIGAIDKAYTAEGSEGEDPDGGEGEEPDTPVIPDTPAAGTHTGGEYYTDSETYTGKRYDFTSSTSHKEVINASDGYSLAPDALTHGKDSDNGYVDFTRPTTEKKKFYLEYRAEDSATALTNHVTVIEQDILFKGIAASNAYAYFMDIFTGSGVGARVQLYFGTDENGKIGFITAGGRLLALDQDTWYNIRFEVYSDAKVKIYVNGEYSAEVQASLKSHSNSTRVDYYLQEAEGSSHGLCIDNLYIGAIDKAYTADISE